MVFGLLMTVLGIGALCALFWRAAVYALPVSVGIWAGYELMQHNVGPVAAIISGFVIGGIVFGLGHTVLVSSRLDALRFTTVTAFVVPAILAGYGAALDLSAMELTSSFWQHAVAILGGAAVGGTAWSRLLVPAEREDAV